VLEWPVGLRREVLKVCSSDAYGPNISRYLLRFLIVDSSGISRHGGARHAVADDRQNGCKVAGAVLPLGILQTGRDRPASECELLDREHFASRAEARMAVFDFIEEEV